MLLVLGVLASFAASVADGGDSVSTIVISFTTLPQESFGELEGMCGGIKCIVQTKRATTSGSPISVTVWINCSVSTSTCPSRDSIMRSGTHTKQGPSSIFRYAPQQSVFELIVFHSFTMHQFPGTLTRVSFENE